MAEMQLHRIDYMHAAAMAPGTLCILPVGKKKQQKVVIGDDSGVLTVFYMKKGEVNVEWKSQELGREITSVVLQLGKDKIFLGCGQSIHGFNRKGKEFVKIKTNLTETINHLFVDENMIWTGGEFIMNIYEQCKDFGLVMVKDRINDLICAPIATGDMLSTIMACQDKFLRVHSGEKLYHEFSVEGPGSALGFYGPPPDKEKRRPTDPVYLIYGTEQGSIGLCSVDAQAMRKSVGISDRMTRPGVAGATSATRRARVSVVHSADVSKSGVHDVVVGRDDGSFEVWSLGDAGPTGASTRAEAVPPTLLFESCLGESIQAMDVGNIAGGEHNEIVLTTYGGKVLGFTPDQAAQDPTGTEIAQVEDKPAAAPGTKKRVLTQAEENNVKQEKDRRFKALEGEIDSLKAKLEKEKAQYQRCSSEQIAVQTTTKVSHRFNLNGEEACYVLTIESQAPLEMVSLRADVEVDLLDHDGTSAILSRSKGDPANPLLATYRMQEPPGSRFQVRLRTVEGLFGAISCFVLPQTTPKTAHLVNLAVKPLSLHEKITEIPNDIPLNELNLKGAFTVQDMHQWLVLCLNELPSRATDDEMVINYKSTFVGTILNGKYAQGRATFKSDSISTISVLKDLITREATARKINVSINVEVREETFPHFLELMHPKLAFQHNLTQQVRMVEPLREVQLQEGDTKFLAEELQMVLSRAAEIQQQFELQPQRLAFLHNIVIAAYRDKWRLKGHQSVEHRVKDLLNRLENYSKEQVIAFFADPID
jgi:Bardet-Biedl syndrome 7 protein